MRPLGPYGFRSVGNIAGGTPGRMAQVTYTIAVAYGTVIMAGDAVKRSGSGRDIERADPGDAVIGFFKGCEYREPDGEVMFRNYWPAGQATQANTVITANVEDDPNIMLESQMNGALTAANIGQLCDLEQTSAPNLQAGVSGQSLDSGTIGSGSQFKIVALSPKFQSNAYGSQSDVYVIPADHELATRAAV